MRFTGKLKTWTDDKGFGFIMPTEGGQDIFVHISEYPRGRTPILNEMLSFEVALNPQGKKKAVRVRVGDALAVTPRQDSFAPMRQEFPARTRRDTPRPSLSRKPSSGGLLRRLIVLAIIVVLGWSGYRYYISRLPPSSAEASLLQGIGKLFRSRSPAASPFSCDGRVHCSQMSSCKEAKYFLKNCPGTKMDGDGDGIPCEQQLCN
jgi:cold shock CspA family protein